MPDKAAPVLRLWRTTGDHRDWNTPPKYVAAVQACLGPVALDPCSNPSSYLRADVMYSLPAHDGLLETWDYPTIFVNPPYGRDRERGTTIKDWLARCAAAGAAGSEVLALVPVATNTAHWKQSVFGEASAVCFLADTRLRFHAGGRAIDKGAPMACAMVCWGDASRFSTVFREYGAIMVNASA